MEKLVSHSSPPGLCTCRSGSASNPTFKTLERRRLRTLQIKSNMFHSIISISVLLIWEFWKIGLLWHSSSLTTVANKKQHSVFSGQGEASLPAPKKTWVQRAETAVCQLGSSGPVWLIQQGFCAGIRMFLSYVRPSEWDFLPPGSQDVSLQFLGTASETPESVALRWQLTSAGAVPAEDSTDFHRISFKIPKNMLYFSQGRLVMAGVELSGLQRNETGGGFWFFWDQELEPASCWCKKRAIYVSNGWKLAPPRVRGRRKVLCFQRFTVLGEENSYTSRFISKWWKLCWKRKKMEAHSRFVLGTNPRKEYANQQSSTLDGLIDCRALEVSAE